MNQRAESLASRIEEGAAGLAEFVEGLSDAQWLTPVSGSDRRSVGVIVHHVATVYPIEIELKLSRVHRLYLETNDTEIAAWCFEFRVSSFEFALRGGSFERERLQTSDPTPNSELETRNSKLEPFRSGSARSSLMTSMTAHQGMLSSPDCFIVVNQQIDLEVS